MHLRPATPDDTDRVKALYVSAFPKGEGETVSSLAADLLAEESIPETFSLVAETDAMIVGHVSFSPVSDALADEFQGYILTPLAVHPHFQKRRIGTNLIEKGIQRLSEYAVDIVFVYGDPQYYARFGFKPDSVPKYVPPYQLQFPLGWQFKPLSDVDAFASSGNLTCVPSLRRPDIW